MFEDVFSGVIQVIHWLPKRCKPQQIARHPQGLFVSNDLTNWGLSATLNHRQAHLMLWNYLQEALEMFQPTFHKLAAQKVRIRPIFFLFAENLWGQVKLDGESWCCVSSFIAYMLHIGMYVHCGDSSWIPLHSLIRTHQLIGATGHYWLACVFHWKKKTDFLVDSLIPWETHRLPLCIQAFAMRIRLSAHIITSHDNIAMAAIVYTLWGCVCVYHHGKMRSW